MSARTPPAEVPQPAALGRVGAPLEQLLLRVATECIACGACAKDCAFLRTYGLPQAIALRFDPEDPQHLAMPFACHLCGLCGAVCPQGLEPATLFLELRREAVARWQGDFPQHKRILAYEERGASPRFSLCALPETCDTVFFPGCSLPGTHPSALARLLPWLQEQVPGLGVVLDCCAKPSHDLGRQDDFLGRFAPLRDMLLEQGVRRVLTACPNCYKVFSQYGRPLETRMLYELLRDKWGWQAPARGLTVCVHDPCPLRGRGETQGAVRELITAAGLDIWPLQHERGRTLCCGEGGSVSHMMPEFAANWTQLRRGEAGERLVITYCSGCTLFLGASMKTCHVLDLLFFPDKALAGECRPVKAPLTYLYRLRLKWRLTRQPGFSRYPRKRGAGD